MPVKLSAPPSADVLLAAYEKHADAMMSQPDDRLLSRVNFDFSSAVAVVLGAQPALLEHRATIKEQLPKFPLVFIDDLDSIAHATLYVFMQTRAATTSDPALAEKVEKAKLQRKILQADAASAVLRNLMDERSVELAPKGNGRLEIAQGLLSLCVAFRAAWSSVKGNTAVTEEMLTDCTRLGVELLAALGRDDTPRSRRTPPPQRRAGSARRRSSTTRTTSADAPCRSCAGTRTTPRISRPPSSARAALARSPRTLVEMSPRP